MGYLIKISSRYFFNEMILKLDLPISRDDIRLFKMGYLMGYPISFRPVIIVFKNNAIVILVFK